MTAPNVRSFGIGLVAGVSPFVFMQLLPLLLNRDAVTPGLGRSALAILLVGLLVGVISSIMLTGTLVEKGPREAFLYALGIPAVLIATVSNLSTTFAAMNQVSAAKEGLTATLLSSPPLDTVRSELAPARPLQRPTMVFQSTSERRPVGQVPQPGTYLLVIGDYSDSASARDAYEKFSKAQLRTERYVPKNLRIVPASARYLLAYSHHSTAEEARKAYQLLRINDPDVSARIVFVR